MGVPVLDVCKEKRKRKKEEKGRSSGDHSISRFWWRFLKCWYGEDFNGFMAAGGEKKKRGRERRGKRKDIQPLTSFPHHANIS